MFVGRIIKSWAGIAQVVERGPEKPGVPSASLGPGTILFRRNYSSRMVLLRSNFSLYFFVPTRVTSAFTGVEAH